MTDGLFGSWDAEIATPIGKQSVVFEFARDSAGHVHGDATDRFGVVPMIDVSVSGMRATWTQHVTRPLRLTLRFESRSMAISCKERPKRACSQPLG